jgi:Protein of unknown function (DUF2997)
MKSIEIMFKADGTTQIEAVGFKGKGCQQATADFEKALGQVTDDRKKPEFFQKSETNLTQTA